MQIYIVTWQKLRSVVKITLLQQKIVIFTISCLAHLPLSKTVSSIFAMFTYLCCTVYNMCTVFYWDIDVTTVSPVLLLIFHNFWGALLLHFQSWGRSCHTSFNQIGAMFSPYIA